MSRLPACLDLLSLFLIELISALHRIFVLIANYTACLKTTSKLPKLFIRITDVWDAEFFMIGKLFDGRTGKFFSTLEQINAYDDYEMLKNIIHSFGL